MFLFQRVFNLCSQACKNIIIGRGIIVGTLFLIHQRNIDEGHQRHCMFTLAPFICLSISIVALSDELGGCTIVLLFIAFDDDFYLFVVHVQRDM